MRMQTENERRLPRLRNAGLRNLREAGENPAQNPLL